MQLTQEQIKLAHIFNPYAWERQTAAIENKVRFVHYTTADAAIKILKSKEVWMRKSSAMNDFREVHHGLDCLIFAYNKSPAGEPFKAALNNLFDGLDVEISKLFDSWIPHFTNDTYLTCVSEHDASEDQLGRLSMWRAYGASGVAIVMNSKPFVTPSDAIKAYTSPVAYLNHQQFQAELEKVGSSAVFVGKI